MTDIQRHRGPDGGVVQAFPQAVLGHRRLSVIDLSARANQPMISAGDKLALIFNGEIYNYEELRAEISERYPFRTTSDSEVLLAAWQLWGPDALARLNGMFAFCIHDLSDGRTWLARDRFGQKPLYYREQRGELIFASETKALLAAGVPAAGDVAVWSRYLMTGTYDDTDATFFEGVSQLLPGEYVEFHFGHPLRRRQFYRIADAIRPRDIGFEDAKRGTRELLVDACRIHMRSDVPVAIMLSGGLDSSAMLAGLDLAGQLNPHVKCFSIDFGPDLTEAPWIDVAARHHHLPSRIDTFSQAEFQASLEPMMWHLEGQLGGLMNCALRPVMQAAHDEGFIVLQDGSGGDEIFAGYRNHHNLYVGNLLRNGHPRAEQAVAEYAENWGVDVDAAQRGALLELERRHTSIDGTVPVRPDLLLREIREAPLLPSWDIGDTGDSLRDSLISYVQGSKILRNTRMLDRLSMGYGLELRLPYLDHRLAEFGLSLPADYYFYRGRSKSIVREAMADAMNDDVRLATKRSIQAPQAKWLMDGPMREFIGDLIASRSFAERGYFDTRLVPEAYARFCDGTSETSFFVWQWINLELWHRTFVDRNADERQPALCPGLTTGETRQSPPHAGAGQA